jgi:hypothetical protein
MSNDVENCPAEEFVKLCLVDDCIGFWENLRDWEGNDFGGIYYSEKGLPDPDWYGYQLYNFHEALWNIQRLKFSNIPELRNNSDYKYNNKKSVGGQYSRVLSNANSSIRLGSDSVMNIYWHRIDMRKFISELIKNKNNDFKIFIREYLKKANTIGGFVLFPRHPQSINQNRGTNSLIDDRFDLTLECIRRYYDKNDQENPLYNVLRTDNDFFEMFGSFEKYAEFFCLNKSYDEKQNWVKDGQVLSLLNNQPLDDYDFGKTTNPLPTADNWWTFYDNIMDRLDARNEQIKKLIQREGD